jgi:TolA-binding protein
MYRTICFASALVILFALPRGAAAHTADEQLAFAEHLTTQGEDGSALLEYRRFLFHHPSHTSAGQAHLMVSRLLISHRGDIAAAKRELDALRQQNPGTQDAERAAQFAQFIDANNDFDGQPLVLYFKARSAAARGDHGEATGNYQRLLDQFSHARLAGETQYEYGRMLIEDMNQPQRGAQMMSNYLAQHPHDAKAPEARYYLAMAQEQQGGSPDAARQTYQQIVTLYPNSDAARRAQARLDDMAQQHNVIQRQYDQNMVTPYQVLSRGDVPGGNRYQVVVRLSPSSTAQQVQATLEQAVIDHQAGRSDIHHAISVEAYFNYPLTKAGKATWQPGQNVQVAVEKRETEDVVTDMIFQLFK